jgi:hypothetical protein
LVFALVQVKLAIDLLLFKEKLAQAVFMLEGTAKLLLVIGKRLLHPLRFGFFLLGIAVKAAQRMFNARYRAF